MKFRNLISLISAFAFTAAGLTLHASEPPQGASPPHTLGSANARVTLEMFGDFQCPQCAGIEPIVKKLQIEFGEKLRVIFRHYPMEKHENAPLAACAAEAAAQQGKFWEMADALFKTQWMWSKAPAPRAAFVDRAKELGLNVPRFEDDLDSPETHRRIGADTARGEALGVKATPSIFINGYFVPNPEMNEKGFRAAIQSALAKGGQ